MENSARKAYSRFGLATALFFISWYAALYLIVFVLKGLNIDYGYDVVILISMVGEVCVAAPVFYLIVKNLPIMTPRENRFTLGKLIGFLAVLYFLSILGSIISDILNSALSSAFGVTSSSDIDSLMEGGLLLTVIDTAIVAPILEELLFRKLLIDRVGQYGQKVAVVMSGFLFGLAHGNFEQFFYAFFIGMMFAYIYIKTGKIKYSIILHCILNSASVILMVLLEHCPALYMDDTNQMLEILLYDPTQLTYFMLILLIELLEYGLAIAGLIVFIKNVKKVTFEEQEIVRPYNPFEEGASTYSYAHYDNERNYGDPQRYRNGDYVSSYYTDNNSNAYDDYYKRNSTSKYNEAYYKVNQDWAHGTEHNANVDYAHGDNHKVNQDWSHGGEHSPNEARYRDYGEKAAEARVYGNYDKAYVSSAYNYNNSENNSMDMEKYSYESAFKTTMKKAGFADAFLNPGMIIAIIVLLGQLAISFIF
jgi:membrane protease YdiL (CAAX protease family)